MNTDTYEALPEEVKAFLQDRVEIDDALPDGVVEQRGPGASVRMDLASLQGAIQRELGPQETPGERIQRELDALRRQPS